MSTGKAGKDGIDGTNGVDGTNGIDGKDGADGAAGQGRAVPFTTGLVLRGRAPAPRLLELQRRARSSIGGGGKVVGASLIESYPTKLRSELELDGDGQRRNNKP